MIPVVEKGEKGNKVFKHILSNTLLNIHIVCKQTLYSLPLFKSIFFWSLYYTEKFLVNINVSESEYSFFN